MTYTDELLEKIIKTLDEVDGYVLKEKKILADKLDKLEDELKDLVNKRNKLVDWDSPEFEEIEKQLEDKVAEQNELEACLKDLEAIKHPF